MSIAMKLSQSRKGRSQNGPSHDNSASFGAHPMEASSAMPAQRRAGPLLEASGHEAALQRKEKVGPDAIPDAHVAYEYIAKMSYMDIDQIHNKPEIVQFLSNFGYSAAEAQVFEGRSGFAMLYIPAPAGGENPPIIAFRGTQPTDLSDLLADIDLSYIGEPQFTNNKELIGQVLESAGSPAVALGHSLGGALAQKASMEFSNHIREVVTFQAPGLGLLEKAEADDREDIPAATHHLAEHDLIDRAGLFHTPGEVFIHDSTLRPITAHTTPLFGSSQFAEEREALGIPTYEGKDGKQVDGILGNEIREQDPEKQHIERHEDYPGLRRLSGFALEVLRSAAGVVKKGGEIVAGTGKLLGKGIKAIGGGIAGLFGGDKDREKQTGGR